LISVIGNGVIKHISELENDGRSDYCEIDVECVDDGNWCETIPFLVWSSAARYVVENMSEGDTVAFRASPRMESGIMTMKITSFEHVR
jgi:hypothetical protein